MTSRSSRSSGAPRRSRPIRPPASLSPLSPGRVPGRRRPHLRPALLAARKAASCSAPHRDRPRRARARNRRRSKSRSPGPPTRTHRRARSRWNSTAPPGVTGTFAPNPTSTGQSILVLEAEKLAEPGKYTVTVDGYVDKGEPSEKHSSVQIPLEITEPFTVDPLGDYPVSRCTPVDVADPDRQGPAAERPDRGRRLSHRPARPSSSRPRPGRSIDSQHVSATLNQQGSEAKMTVTRRDGSRRAGRKTAESPWSPRRAATRTRSATGTIAIEPVHVDSVTPGRGRLPSAATRAP